MTRGRPPGIGMKEAKEIAGRQGDLCQNTKGRGLLYDFTIHLLMLTICVRVRRTRLIAITSEDLLTAYPRDVARIRRVPATPVCIREIWVRSDAGTWQYFLVLDDRIVEIPGEILQQNGGDRYLRGDAPGPDRSALPGISPATGREFVCPFMVPSK